MLQSQNFKWPDLKASGQKIPRPHGTTKSCVCVCVRVLPKFTSLDSISHRALVSGVDRLTAHFRVLNIFLSKHKNPAIQIKTIKTKNYTRFQDTRTKTRSRLGSSLADVMGRHSDWKAGGTEIRPVPLFYRGLSISLLLFILVAPYGNRPLYIRR